MPNGLGLRFQFVIRHPELLAACRPLGGCPTGEARITPGFRLPAKWVIHTPGPVWRGGKAGEAALLANCYRNSLRLATEHGARTVAFPAISTGVYGYPLEAATRIAIHEACVYLEAHPDLERVVFACFGAAALECYRKVLAETTTGG